MSKTGSESLTWPGLHSKFREIVKKAGGPSKSSSGIMDITYNFEGIRVTLGTYDIGFWDSFTWVGPFDTEEEAMQATLNKLNEADARVQADIDCKCSVCGDSITSDADCSCDAEESQKVNEEICACATKCVCGKRFSYGLEK